MNFFKDLFNSIKFTARERTTNVYIGSFSFSWLAVNWKFWILLIFGEGTVDTRITKTEQLLNWVDGLLIPILISSFICFVLPRINKLIVKFQNEPNNYIKRINDIADTRSLKSLARKERLRAKAETARDRESAAQELEIQRYKEEIQKSKDQSLKLTDEIQSLKEHIGELTGSLNDTRAVHAQQLKDKENEISKLTKDKKSAQATVTENAQKIQGLEQEITRLKKNIASNSAGIGLPGSLVDGTPKVGGVLPTAGFNTLTGEALRQAMLNTAKISLMDAAAPTARTLKNVSENGINNLTFKSDVLKNK